MKAIHEAGLRIPEDISIAGLGDSWAGTYVQPALTTAHLYYRQCGREAASMLLRMIADSSRSMVVTQTMLEYTIVERESL
jgi:LacI family sucrose operon transcriptional repressor